MGETPEPDILEEDIQFDTWNPLLPSDMTKPEIRKDGFRGVGTLYRPAGDQEEKRPAVILVQGLGGPKRSREHAYGRWLAGHGYIALVPSTFASRSHRDSEHTWRALRVTTAMMTADTFGGLKFLRAQPYVDANAIFVVGFSYGGMVAVLSAYDQIMRYFLDGGPSFAGHVAYYGCSVPRMDDPTTTGAPVLMLLGAKDRNVSIPRSRQIAEDLRRGGSPVDLRIFEQAYHQWDSGERKRELFSLRPCHIRIDRHGVIRDEATGHSLNGWFDRLRFLTFNVSPKGYHIVPDEEVTTETNGLLLDFLDKVRRGSEVGEPTPNPAGDQAAHTD